MKKIKKNRTIIYAILMVFSLNIFSLFSNNWDSNKSHLQELIIQNNVSPKNIISFLLSKIEKIRAPRLDAPDSSDGAIVGPFVCDNEQVLQLINQLIAIIEQCCNTIEIDFEEIFMILTILAEDFSGTFTQIQDLKNTLTIDFNGTFTALEACCNEIFVDFNGVFTALTTLNETVTIDFNGTFTELVSIIADFGSTFTALQDLKNTLTIDFNGTFTALTACCNEIFVDFNGVFTTLSALKETLTTDFNGTFTALEACCNEAFVDFNGVFTTLTDLKNTLTIDFNGTFTVIAALSLPCSATPITQPIIITSPGYYCLSNDLLATLSIGTSNVTVDLNSKVIHATDQVGIFINGGSNIVITNGAIKTTSIGIELVNTSTVTFNNLLITNCSETGILLNPSCHAVRMRDIIIDTVANHGINCVNDNNDLQCQRVTLINFGGFFGIGTNGSLSNSLFEECQILDSLSTLTRAASFMIASGINNQLVNCAVVNNQNSVGTVLAFVLGSNNSSLDNCITQSLVGDNLAEGYVISGEHSTLDDCIVQNILSVNGSFGFIISGTSITLNNCFVQTATFAMSNAFGAGFDVSGSEVNLINSRYYFLPFLFCTLRT
jgi:hypothetical protein